MRKFLILAVFILIPVVFAQNVFVSEGGAADLPRLELSVESVEPEPVEPGEDVTIKVRIHNTGGANAHHVTVYPDIKYPFKFKNEVDDFEDITLCAGCSMDNTYYLQVDSDAVTGVYSIDFTAMFGERAGQRFGKTVEVDVRGIPDLLFTTHTVDAVVPNSNFRSMLTIQNIGTGLAKQIKIRPVSEKIIVLGSTVKTVDVLQPGETVAVPLEFTCSENIDPDVYHIPVEITGMDERGNEYETTEHIGARVVHSGDINIESIKINSLTGATVIRQDEPFTIISRVENVGYGEAEFISAELDCPFDGNKRAYVGKLEEDEDAPAVFRLKSKNPGYFNCMLATSFRDDLGTHTNVHAFDVFIESNHLFRNILLGSLGLGILVAGLFFYKRSKREEK